MLARAPQLEEKLGCGVVIVVNEENSGIGPMNPQCRPGAKRVFPGCQAQGARHEWGHGPSGGGSSRAGPRVLADW